MLRLLALLAALCAPARARAAGDALYREAFDCPPEPIERFERPYTYPRLARFIHCRGLDTIDKVLTALPLEFKENFVLVYNSRGRHGNNARYPRMILSDLDSKMIVATAGSADLRNGNVIEIIAVDPDEGYIAREIVFETDDRPGRVRYGAVNRKVCLKCHRDPPTPNWGSYPFWPGAYGSGAGEGSREPELYADFLEHSAAGGRYRHLVGLTKPMTLSQLAEANSTLSNVIGTINAEHMLDSIAAQPGWPAAKFALMAAYKGCADFQEAVPARLRAAFKEPFPAARERARTRALAIYNTAIAKTYELAGGSPPGSEVEEWLYDYLVRAMVRTGWLLKELLGFDLERFTVTPRGSVYFSHHTGRRFRLEKLDYDLWKEDCAVLRRKSLAALAAFEPLR